MLQQLSDAYSKNSPWWLPDPESDRDWEANAVCTGSGLWDWEPRRADAITWEGRLKAVCLLWLGGPELEAVLVKEKISRTPEFIDWQPLIFFPDCSGDTVSWWLLIEIFLQFQY